VSYHFLPEELQFSSSATNTVYSKINQNSVTQLHKKQKEINRTQSLDYSYIISLSNREAEPLYPVAITRTPIVHRRRKSFGTTPLETNTPSAPTMFQSPAKDVFIPCLARYLAYEISSNEYSPSVFDKPTDEVPVNTTACVPTVKKLLRFLNRFIEKDVATQCMVVGMIYLGRIRNKVTLNGLNWQRLILIAFIIAEKNIVDAEIWNEDYAGILDIDLAEILRIEKLFLKEIHYNLSLTTSEYGVYCFSLLSLKDEEQEDEQKRNIKNSNQKKKMFRLVNTEDQTYP